MIYVFIPGKDEEVMTFFLHFEDKGVEGVGVGGVGYVEEEVHFGDLSDFSECSDFSDGFVLGK